MSKNKLNLSKSEIVKQQLAELDILLGISENPTNIVPKTPIWPWEDRINVAKIQHSEI